MLRLITNKRYKQLIDIKTKLLEENSRKEKTIQRKQKKLRLITSWVWSLNNKSTKTELLKVVKKIKHELND